MPTNREFTIRDPHWREKVADSWSRQKFMLSLGAHMVAVEPGYCEIHLPFREELTQSHGYYHGASIGAIADVAGGYAAFTLTPPGSSMLTVEYKINFLAPGQGERLIARGYVEKSGRTLTIARSDIVSLRDGAEHQCATALMTMIRLEGEEEVRA